LFTVDEAQVVGGRLLGFDDALLGARVSLVARQMQHAGPTPAQRQAGGGQGREMRGSVLKTGASQPREAVVVERGQGPQDAGEVAGGAFAGRLCAFDQGDRPAARGQPFGGAAAGQAGADDDRVAAHAPAASAAYSARICGKRITSRMFAASVSSITSRSMPMPQPAVGGRPYSSART
jgi:hypothetical protein